MTETKADLVIVGGGSGGYAAALRGAQLGMSVVLIEQDKVGGTCLHRGCIPTKALLHVGSIADSIRASSKYGIDATLLGVNAPEMHRYKDRVISRLYRGLQGLLKSRNIQIVEGHGRLISPTTVTVGVDRYVGEHVVLATGSSAASIPGVEIGGNVMTSDEALQLESVPKDVLVLGGGVVGVEFASYWASLGAKVTVLEASGRLLPNDDEFISKQVSLGLRRRGIKIKTGVVVAETKTAGDRVTAVLKSGEAFEAEYILVAVGRKPNIAEIGLTESGVELTRDFVSTDSHLRTNLPSVFAVGDLVEGPQLAHRGFQHGIFVAELLAGLEPTPVDELALPRVLYSTPEAVSVGMTTAHARSRYGDEGINEVVYDLAGNGKSQVEGSAGAIAVTSGPDSRIVGVHMVGSKVSELAGEAQLLYGLEIHVADAARFLHAHPTRGEGLGEALLALAGKPLHVHS
ncbi:dihydrolipoamide dehydrogenase (plasmid) [Rhodococcus erythropolis]|uniref:dihydrolipoyl dehydrogenase n=1 Tax=Rhodococcus erythropolis TaxID=1833 RepID=UPI00061B716E|nr:dihydrolipoyl dehydrogenase [Rhodococcus erythropolis]AKE01238.1 dihydrolipoamide dehydrogenase [Rhodococcus erythropolis]